MSSDHQQQQQNQEVKPFEIPTPWWPKHAPIYDIEKSYDDNSTNGPFFDGPFPTREQINLLRPPKDQWVDFLGFKVASPIGVPAGPLLNSNWTTLAARLGFDIPTYKTIRSRPHAGHPLPNVVYVDTNGPLSLDQKNQIIKTNKKLISELTMHDLAITNSFGMPSKDAEFLREDIARANAAMGEGQVLIVSVVGTPCGSSGCGGASDAESKENFIQDFVNTALFAQDAGAKIIEANFSCPNVASGEGSIYHNPETVHEISSRIVKALAETAKAKGTTPPPLIIKVGAYEDLDLMRRVFISAASAGVKAIHGINTVSMKVVNADTEEPALGQGRLTSGVCGGPIRNVALDWLKNANEINRKENLGLTIIGCGGITAPEHFEEFLSVPGTKAAMSATGMMWDPYLAMRYHQRQHDKAVARQQQQHQHQ